MTEVPGEPLAGLRVVEFAGIGPGPHGAMLLSDLGADVLRISRPGGTGWPNPVADRGRAEMVLDLRTSTGLAQALLACEYADVLIEGFRPGVMERLGLGPDIVLERNPRVVYARMTGWGQAGPLAQTAGHDVNYIALSGVLAAIGKPGEPATLPLNLIGDFGGGSMLLAFGIMVALWERERSGKGQVIDAAIIDGVASLMTMFAGLLPSGRVSLERGHNVFGGAAPFYRCYVCADGREIAVGAVEPAFYRAFIERLGAPPEFLENQHDERHWLAQSVWLEGIFQQKNMAEWLDWFEGVDACVSPVLRFDEVPAHPHLLARGTYFERDGFQHAAPAPRFSRTPGRIREAESAEIMLRAWSQAGHAKAEREG